MKGIRESKSCPSCNSLVKKNQCAKKPSKKMNAQRRINARTLEINKTNPSESERCNVVSIWMRRAATQGTKGRVKKSKRKEMMINVNAKGHRMTKPGSKCF